VCVHCPYNQQGLAFRKFARSWPGYPSAACVTDANADLEVLVGRAVYAQTPFEPGRISKDGYAFAGLIDYEPLVTEEPDD